MVTRSKPRQEKMVTHSKPRQEKMVTRSKPRQEKMVTQTWSKSCQEKTVTLKSKISKIIGSEICAETSVASGSVPNQTSKCWNYANLSHLTGCQIRDSGHSLYFQSRL